MANIVDVRRQPIMVNLNDGTERELKFTLNSFALMEEKYGTVEAAMKAMEAGSVSAIRFLLYAGLCHIDENLTEKQVGALIDIQELQALTEKMNKAMTGDMPNKMAAPGESPKA
jgi:hypothetical protein